MKIYVIGCGKFESYHVAMATEDIDLADIFVTQAMERTGFDEVLVDIQCWEDGKLLERYERTGPNKFLVEKY